MQALENDNNEALKAVEQKFVNFQSNVSTFVHTRETNRGTFSLVFEANETNSSMINEAILGYYMSKTFSLPKEKFRFLNTEYFTKTVD